jgi:diguanylate cyclase (GGDEF)-like protein
VLEVAGVFDPSGTLDHSLHSRLPVRRFPPPEMIEMADPTTGQMLFLAPLKERTSDRGMMALVGPVEAWAPTGRDTISQWAALLTIALDHEAVLDSLREREDRLQHAALYDELTELPNRALFLDRINQAIRRTERHPDRRFAVLMLDLDDFKVVNDSLGHVAGDRLLEQVADRIRSTLRACDTAARLSGDEFALVVEDLDEPDGHLAVVDRLREALAAPYLLDGQQVVLTASIGITLSTTGGRQAQDLLRDADTATYSAKAREKGSHSVFDVAMHHRAMGRLRVEAELRRAIETGQLEVHFQPVVRLPQGLPIGFEALVRWQHPERGLVPPGQFLPVAVESGLVLPIDRWVLAEACRQLRHWQLAGLATPTMRISVNISNRNFWHGDLLENVRDTLAKTELAPSCLALEITEGVIMRDAIQARRLLREVHELGVHVHMDDFGTGYSSLEVLHRLSLDALKVDRSFVAAMGNETKSQELIRTIVLMGTNLGLELIAEGIETPAQKDYLASLGCGFGQGFWFSPPVPADQAERYLSLARALPAQRSTSPEQIRPVSH